MKTRIVHACTSGKICTTLEEVEVEIGDEVWDLDVVIILERYVFQVLDG